MSYANKRFYDTLKIRYTQFCFKSNFTGFEKYLTLLGKIKQLLKT